MARRAAFTLVELLVTMAVSALLIVFLFQLFNATAKAWKSGEDQTDTYREARAALQLMVRDIGSTTAPLMRNAYAVPTPTPSSSPAPGIVPVLVLDQYPSSLADPARQPDDAINEELYCLTNIPNSGSSSLCAAGYFCEWMPDVASTGNAQQTAAAPRAYALYRQFLGSGSAAAPGLFERFKAVNSASTQPLSFINLYERARPGTIPAASLTPPVATATQLASYIWDLQFRTAASAQATSSPSDYPAGMPLPTPPSTLPAYVEIRFKALSTGAARQLEGNTSVTRAAWNDNQINSAIYQHIIQPGTRQFVARVPIAAVKP